MTTDSIYKLYAYNNGQYLFFYRPEQKGYWCINPKAEDPIYAMSTEEEFLTLMKQKCTPTEYYWDTFIYQNYTDEFNVPMKVGSKEIWTLEENWRGKYVQTNGLRGGNRGWFEIPKYETLAPTLIKMGEIRQVLENITRHKKWPQIEEKAYPAGYQFELAF